MHVPRSSSSLSESSSCACARVPALPHVLHEDLASALATGAMTPVTQKSTRSAMRDGCQRPRQSRKGARDRAQHGLEEDGRGALARFFMQSARKSALRAPPEAAHGHELFVVGALLRDRRAGLDEADHDAHDRQRGEREADERERALGEVKRRNAVAYDAGRTITERMAPRDRPARLLVALRGTRLAPVIKNSTPNTMDAEYNANTPFE